MSLAGSTYFLHFTLLYLPFVHPLQAVAVLHCLQRLASHPHMAEQLLSASTALSRVWACLACGSDHVVAEGARLLVRLFAPAPARHGAAAWRLLRSKLLPRGGGGMHMELLDAL